MQQVGPHPERDGAAAVLRFCSVCQGRGLTTNQHPTCACAGAPGLQQTTGVVQAGGALPPKTITQAAATANAAQSVAVNDQPDRSQSETKAVEKTSTGCLPTKWTGKVDDYKLTKDAVACAVDEHVSIPPLGTLSAQEFETHLTSSR